eukprot:2031377-Amphidinium_carterae.1
MSHDVALLLCANYNFDSQKVLPFLQRIAQVFAGRASRGYPSCVQLVLDRCCYFSHWQLENCVLLRIGTVCCPPEAIR